VKRQAVGDVPGRDNLLAVIPGTSPTLLLTTHLDTVPPHFDPYRSDDGEWLFGRGVCDAKGIAAAMVCAAFTLPESVKDKVGMLFVVGEETHSDGAKAAAQGFMPRVKYFIDGEPTDLRLVKAMKGVLGFQLSVKGKAAHSAYPDAGKSAIHHLLEDLKKLVDHPWPAEGDLGDTTLNVGVIQGGAAPNVLAPFAEASCLMRTATDADLLKERLLSLLSEGTQIDIRSTASPLRLFCPPGFETCVVAFGSDVPYLKPLGTPLLVGPGSILDAHTAHEKVRVDDLGKAQDLYRTLCIQLCGDDMDISGSNL